MVADVRAFFLMEEQRWVGGKAFFFFNIEARIRTHSNDKIYHIIF